MNEWVCVYCIIVPFLFFRPLFVSFHSPLPLSLLLDFVSILGERQQSER